MESTSQVFPKHREQGQDTITEIPFLVQKPYFMSNCDFEQTGNWR